MSACYPRATNVSELVPEKGFGLPDVAFKGSRKKVAELSDSSSYLGDGWIEYASGSGGNGEGTLSATNSDQGEPAARYVQKTPSQNGLPSITKLAGDALTYAESSKTINFPQNQIPSPDINC